MTDDPIVSAIMQREGGFVDHPADKGGPTKYGITLAVLAAWRGKAVYAADVQALSEDEARAIYEAKYWMPFVAIKNNRVRGFLVDWGVNSGIRTAVVHLQRVLAVAVDGLIGPHTAMEANSRDPEALMKALIAARLDFVRNIAEHDPTQAVFLAGWENRILSFAEV